VEGAYYRGKGRDKEKSLKSSFKGSSIAFVVVLQSPVVMAHKLQFSDDKFLFNTRLLEYAK